MAEWTVELMVAVTEGLLAVLTVVSKVENWVE